MSKFNYFRSELILRRDDILIRLINKEGIGISNLLLYRKKQELVEDALNTFNRKKRRRSVVVLMDFVTSKIWNERKPKKIFWIGPLGDYR